MRYVVSQYFKYRIPVSYRLGKYDSGHRRYIRVLGKCRGVMLDNEIKCHICAMSMCTHGTHPRIYSIIKNTFSNSIYCIKLWKLKAECSLIRDKKRQKRDEIKKITYGSVNYMYKLRVILFVPSVLMEKTFSKSTSEWAITIALLIL